MRRTLVIAIALLAAALPLFFAPWAGAGTAGRAVPVTPPPPGSPEGVDVVLEPLAPADIQADPASDTCAAAPDLGFDYDTILEVGGQTLNLQNFTNEGIDPPLFACMFAKPINSTGYRSAWYKFTAPVGGTLVVKTASDADYKRNFDSLVAIYRDDSPSPDTCTNLALLGCNDDAHGLLSEASARIEGGETYYVEVVDRFLATTGQLILNLEARIIPDPTWNTGVATLPGPLSRHAVVVSGTQAYVLGGATTLGASPVRTGDTWRFDTTTGVWTLLGTLNIGATPNGEGYMNTDAIRVDNELHLVSGSVGSTAEYEGQHWVFNLLDNTWKTILERGGPQLDWSTTPAGKPVGYSQLTHYQSGSQKGFYLIGGLTGKFFDIASDPSEVKPSNIFYRFVDTGISRLWQPLPGMTKARYAHGAVTISNFVCVVGGLSTGINSGTGLLESQIVFDGECYNQNTGAWDISVGTLNYPRYNAHSVVGPDGRWYIMGGLGCAKEETSCVPGPIPFTEVYDFTFGQWEVMPANFDISAPPLSWVRGDFVGDTLWLFGGEQKGNGEPIPVLLVQTKRFPVPVSIPGPARAFLPFLKVGGPAVGEAPVSAVPLTLGVPQQGNFEGIGDVYDVYTFVWPGGTMQATLTTIPFGSDYDLLLYDANKVLIAAGQNIGSNPELLSGPLLAGRHYLIVARSAPPPATAPHPQPYTVEVR